MSPAPSETRATTIGKWLLAVTIPLSALALGSLPPSALVVMSVLAAVACALLWSSSDEPVSRASRIIIVAVVVLVLFTGLQALPIPASLARALSPSAADIWERALSPLREPGPALHPLSVAPGATHLELLKGVFYACVFLGALRVTGLRDGERFLSRLVVASAVIMALTALGHAAVGAEKVFGVYRPREIYAYTPNRYAPLLNTNHLAAYLGIGACVALDALLSRRLMPRALSGSALLILCGMSVWQGSRGAAGALVFSVLLVFALTLYSKRHIESRRAGALVLVGCLIAATLLVTVTYSDMTLFRTGSPKGELAMRSLRLVRESPWFGFGRGSFETVFAAVRPAGVFVTWTNPEDIVVQWLVEWGAPITFVAFGLLAWAFRPQLIFRAVRPAVGAWVAIIATVLHDLVDYHLEIPGIVALAAVCAALAVSGRPTRRESERRTVATSARVTAMVCAAASLAAVVWVWPDLGHSLAETRRRLAAEAVDPAVSADAFRSDVRSAMLRFPAEAFIPLMGAVRAQVVDGASVIPWAGRALERNPHFGRAHLVLARSLVARNPAQARLEYRLAGEYDDGLRSTIEKEALVTVDGAESAFELVPPGPEGVEMLDRLASGIAARLPSSAVLIDEEIERRAPGSPDPVRRRVRAEVIDATTDAPWCAGRECAMRALASAEDLARREPDRCEPYVLVARVRVKLGDARPALDALERDVEKVSDHPQCLQELIMLSNEAGQTRRADAALELLVRGGCGGAQECLGLYAWAASIEEQRGHYVRAVRLYRRILEIEPEREEILERIGQLGDKDGLLTEALDAYRTLSLRHPDDARYPARIAELRGRVHSAVPTLPTLTIDAGDPAPD